MGVDRRCESLVSSHDQWVLGVPYVAVDSVNTCGWEVFQGAPGSCPKHQPLKAACKDRWNEHHVWESEVEGLSFPGGAHGDLRNRINQMIPHSFAISGHSWTTSSLKAIPITWGLN